MRRCLEKTFAPDGEPVTPVDRQRVVVVAVSGGADSLALAAAVAFEAPKQHTDAHVVIVDHGLQDASADIAAKARQQCLELGYPSDRVQIRRVVVEPAADGVEAAARQARYHALWEAAREVGSDRILLGHTADDQAEQVLLGLLRGSGTRSLAGMRVERSGLLRPFIQDERAVPNGPVRRRDTRAACRALRLEPWHDPHNDDRAYRRVQARQVLAELSEQLDAPTLGLSLFRTASLAARDADYLDSATERALREITGSDDPETWPSRWPVEALAALSPALRLRALRRLLVLCGARDSELAARHVNAVEDLLVNWRGQGPIQVPGHVQVQRRRGELAIEPLTRDNNQNTQSDLRTSERMENGSGRQPHGR